MSFDFSLIPPEALGKSTGETDLLLISFLHLISPRTHLDIGAGSGKYGHYSRQVLPSTRRIAIELDAEYAERYRLAEAYDEVRIQNVMSLLDEVDSSWDLVTIGDCIEHLRKSDGVDLLHFLMYRCKWLFLSYPLRYIQNSVEGRSAEAHISTWGAADFQLFSGQLEEAGRCHAVFLDGFLLKTEEPHCQQAVQAIQQALKNGRT